MKTVRALQALKQAIGRVRHAGKSLGYVPTMGALHRGHLALVKRSRRENASTLVSIFVNPLQFGPGEDLKRYPRPITRDIRLLKKAKTDILFLPSARSLFRAKAMARHGAPPRLKGALCGPFRPGHFDGVWTIVRLFLHLIRPDRAYFGQKDYQQYRIVQEMTRREFGEAVQIRLVGTVRDKGGLALSSRNEYLSPEVKKEAWRIFRGLQRGRGMIKNGPVPPVAVVQSIRRYIEKSPQLTVQYVDIVDSQTLRKVVELNGKKTKRVLIGCAVLAPGARLIDNILVRIN